jgi:hypothetical protein
LYNSGSYGNERMFGRIILPEESPVEVAVKEI